MQEIVRTNDPVLVTAIEAVLKGAGIAYQVFDQNMSVMEGSIGILPRRILVPDDNVDQARQVLKDAGFGNELRPDDDG